MEEQNDWGVASDKLELTPYLSSEILKNDNPNMDAPFGFGKVKDAGRIYPSELLKAYRIYLQKERFVSS